MTSIEERLAASDPAGASPYAPGDHDAMISRVVATPWRTKDPVWRAFRARMAGSVLVAGLVTGVSVAALGSLGPSLSVLDLAATAAPKALASKAPTFGVMVRYVNYQFTGAAAFSSTAGSLPVYDLTSSAGSSTLSQVAQTLGVTIGTVASGDGGQTYASSGSASSGQLVQDAGYATWTINVALSVAGVPPRSTSGAVTAVAVADAQRLGGFEVGSPVTTGASGLSEMQTGAYWTVTVPIDVGGDATSWSYSFSFASDGQLVTASGFSSSLQEVASYPVVSPAAGVGEITGLLGLAGLLNESGTNGGGSVIVGTGAASTSTTSSEPPTAAGVAPVSTSTTPTTLAPTVVNLVSVSTRYVPFATAGGTTALIPVYVYTGSEAGVSTPVTFSVLAVEPGYVKLPTYE